MFNLFDETIYHEFLNIPNIPHYTLIHDQNLSCLSLIQIWRIQWNYYMQMISDVCRLNQNATIISLRTFKVHYLLHITPFANKAFIRGDILQGTCSDGLSLQPSIIT